MPPTDSNIPSPAPVASTPEPIVIPPPSSNNSWRRLVITAVILVAAGALAYVLYNNEVPTPVLEGEDIVEGVVPAATVPEVLPETPTAPVTTPVANPSERDVIIAALMKRREVFASQDAAQIRAYLEAGLTAEQKAQIGESTDEEILTVAAMTLALADYTEADLRSPAAIWEIGTDKATIKIEQADGTLSVKASKLNGIWR